MLILAVSTAHAFTPEIFDLESQVDLAAKKALSDQAIARLYEFRKSVQNDAYITTLKLCEGYRRAQGLGPNAYHGKWMYTVGESLEAWARVIREGFWVPWDSRMSEYGELFPQKPLTLDYWFRSLYTLYLFDSPGFIQGAMHCLNTVGSREISYFAYAIAYADMYSGMVDYGLTATAGTAGALRVIAEASRFSFFPARKLFEFLSSRLFRSYLIRTGMVVGPILADDLDEEMRQVDEKKKEVSGEAQEKYLNPDQYTRMKLVAKYYRKLEELLEAQKQAKAGRMRCQSCSALAGELMAFSRAQIPPPLEAEMRQDFIALNSQGQLSAGADLYLVMLRACLPVLESK